MQQAVAEQQPSSAYRQEFNRRNAPINEPAWLAERRARSFAQFEAVGFPSRRDEAWRHTNVRAVAQEHFALAPLLELPPPRTGLGLPDAYRLQFLDGHLVPTNSAVGGLPEGARIEPLSMALYRHDGLLEEHWGAHLQTENAFAALNGAFAHDGAVIHLRRGVVLQRPLLLEFVRSAQSGLAAYPRVLIVLEEGAEAEVVEYFRGPADTAYLTSAVTEIALAANAGLSWYKLQEEGAQGFHFASVTANVARDARFKGHSFARGGRISRTDIVCRLNGEGADAELNGLYLTSEGQLSDHHTWMEHNAGHCSSRQRFKGVLSGKSVAVYDGLVKVAHGAVKTDAQQQNRNLLLNKRALAHSNPRLEIYTDDVKCSHGSTVGELDRDALFYLRSRGLGKAEAETMLTFAFAEEQLASIGIDALREHESEVLGALLAGSSAGGEAA